MLVPKLLLTPIKIRIFGPKTAKFGPKILHFWSFWAKYCHFLHLLSNSWPKNYMNKVPRWVFRYVGNKTFDFSSKKKDFLPKNDQIWPKTGIFGQFGPGHAGLFSALLVGRLVVVARGLYLARHLFTLYRLFSIKKHIVLLLCMHWSFVLIANTILLEKLIFLPKIHCCCSTLKLVLIANKWKCSKDKLTISDPTYILHKLVRLFYKRKI